MSSGMYVQNCIIDVCKMDWADAIRDENASDLLDRLDNLKCVHSTMYIDNAASFSQFPSIIHGTILLILNVMASVQDWGWAERG